jgi:iron uptake system component EfeO
MRPSFSHLAYFASAAVGLMILPPAADAAAGTEAIKSIDVTINDKGCDPMQLTVPPTKVAFKIKNASRRGVEWEILKDNMVVEERENIIPGFTSTLTTKLDPSEYEMTCGLVSNPKGKLIVQIAAKGEDAAKAADLDEVIASYKTYVGGEVDNLVKKTRALVDAVKAGKLEAAQKAYAPAHLYYERIEPVAEVFDDLDKSMDSRADDYEKKEADPNFSGYHRIEYGLFEKKSTEGLAPYADKLMKDALDLQGRISKLKITPKQLVGGAAELIEEVASKKISGEEDRYSKTDLWDFRANLDGAQKIVALLRKDIKARDAELLSRIETNFAKVDSGLDKYKAGSGFEPYNALKSDDQKKLKGPITVLAEDLSKLRGTLGID